MSVEPKNATVSIPVGTIVTIVLVILKATGHIAMPWFWVISSIFWVPLGIMAVFLVIFLVVALFKALFDN